MWGDAPPRNIEFIRRRLNAERLAAGIDAHAPRSYLAISGGGSDGAFGAGLLVGWSDTGARPKFDVVTGTSAGAMIAPFAFLGSTYDGQLKEIYTTYGQKDIAQRRPVFLVGLAASLASDAPLAALIERYVSPEFLAAVAIEHRRGRRLLIGTTYLDAQRPVIWDMGEIASAGDQKALALFRQVILASASIPGIFPPVLITVDRDGKTYDEMHVDGGVVSQVFLFPTNFDPRSLDPQGGQTPVRQLFVIRNGRVTAEWEAVDSSILKIASRSISSLIKYQGRGDLDRIYFESRRHNVAFRFASIPSSFSLTEKEPFDLQYMKALFEAGYALGQSGNRWQEKPPDF
jgi:Patatin-like phospholipase